MIPDLDDDFDVFSCDCADCEDEAFVIIVSPLLNYRAV